jgi:hypothetical protein
MAISTEIKKNIHESGLSYSCDSEQHATMIQKEKYKHQMTKKSVHWKSTCGQMHIEHFNDMSESEVRSIWYNQGDYKAFKQDYIDTAKLERQGKNLRSTPSSCTRGFEVIISSRRGCLRLTRRELGWDAVLLEQCLQRETGCCSPSLIAKKYHRVSEVCQRDASLAVEHEYKVRQESVPQQNKSATKVEEEAPWLTEAEVHQEGSERAVQFSTVEIRSYPICAGDNPAVTKGVAITIEWDHDSVRTVPLEEYEDGRPFPRSLTQIRMTPIQRADRLRAMGYSRSEIQEWVQRVDRLRKQRMRTTKSLALAPMEEFLEGIRRVALNATIRRSAKRKEKQFLYSSVY